MRRDFFDEDPKSDVALIVPKRRIWPVLLVLFGIVAAAGFAVWKVTSKPEPLRVLVAIDLDGHWWEGSAAAATLADQLAKRLEKIGFETVRGGDPDVADVLAKAKSPEDAARTLRAAFLITAAITPEIIEHKVDQANAPARVERLKDGVYFEVRADAPLEVRYIDDEPGEPAHLKSWSGAPERPEALRILADSLADMVFDAAVPAITGHPTIQALFKGNDIARASKIGAAKSYVELRERKMKEVADAYEKLAKERVENERGPGKIVYHGPLSSQHLLGGTGAGGVLVKTADVRPFLSPDSLALRYYGALETLEWRAPDAAPRVLWSGYNLFTYPSVAREGAPVVFVEDLFGWAKTITVVEADGKSRRVRVDPIHRFLSPKAAPGGKAAALYDRPCRECDGGLLVISLEDGKDLYRKDAKEGDFGGFAWLDPKHLAFVHTPVPVVLDVRAEGPEPSAKADPDPPKQALYVLDLGASPPAMRSVAAASPEDRYESPAASPDGKRVALELYGPSEPRLAVIDVESGAVKTYPTQVRARSPSFSPDGKAIAFDAIGDIAVLDLETGRVTRLTENPYNERYPAFSSDGARIYFESTGTDPNFSRRGVGVIASVTARP